MGLDATGAWRWACGVALVVALGLLIAGETVFRGRLGGLGFIVYWMTCFAFTGLAVLLALLYVRALRGRSRQEQRELLADALQQIQDEARTRAHKKRRG